MSNESIQVIAEQIKDLDAQLEEAAELIAIARDAGEDVTPLMARLRTMQNKQRRWKDALIKHGYDS